MKQNFRKAILLILVLLMLVPIFTGCSADSSETLSIEVLHIAENANGMQIIFLTRNNTGYNVSLGWVGSCQIEVTTTEDTYYYEPFMSEIHRGRDELSITVPNCTGTVEKIVFTDLRLLDIGGNLPGRQMRNVVVYDTANGIESFIGTFSFFSSPYAIVSLIIILLPTLLILAAIAAVVLVVVIVLIVIFRIRKKKAKAPVSAKKSTDDQNGFAPPPCE